MKLDLLFNFLISSLSLFGKCALLNDRSSLLKHITELFDKDNLACVGIEFFLAVYVFGN